MISHLCLSFYERVKVNNNMPSGEGWRCAGGGSVCTGAGACSDLKEKRCNPSLREAIKRKALEHKNHRRHSISLLGVRVSGRRRAVDNKASAVFTNEGGDEHMQECGCRPVTHHACSPTFFRFQLCQNSGEPPPPLPPPSLCVCLCVCLLHFEGCSALQTQIDCSCSTAWKKYRFPSE